MRITNAEKLSMCKEHMIDGKSLSHISERYDNNQEDIVIIKGSSSIVDDVKKLYKKEFEKSRIEYNEKQKAKNKLDNSNINNDNFSIIRLHSI